MKVNLVSIGNSEGVRIPRSIIKACGFGDQVEMRVSDGAVVLAPAHKPREDWDAASAYLDKSDVQARWQAEHADILDVDTTTGLVPLQMLEELFHQD